MRESRQGRLRYGFLCVYYFLYVYRCTDKLLFFYSQMFVQLLTVTSVVVVIILELFSLHLIHLIVSTTASLPCCSLTLLCVCVCVCVACVCSLCVGWVYM